MTTIEVNTPSGTYPVHVGRGLLEKVGELFSLDRRVFILTDTGVPARYAEAIRAACRESTVYTVPMGEGSKSLTVMEEALVAMLHFDLTRTDCVVAVGGGVVGDLGGFLAATYMRGIDFYNVPTTMLSQVDSSIGGKTAVNLGTVKNIVGAFHQPRGVLVDLDTLKTLPARHVSAGLCEAIKMAASFDEELFCRFEELSREDAVCEETVTRALDIKRRIVEADEREAGLRRVLNLGHTLGHGIEAAEGLGGLYHGECVALGMLAVCSDEVKARLLPVFEKFGLPTEYKGSLDTALSYIRHDKKCEGDQWVCVVLCERIGTWRIERMTLADFERNAKDRICV